MVRGSTLLAVWAALPPRPTPLRELAEAVQMERNTVRDALVLLIRLGLAVRIEHSAEPSAKKGGWIRIEYQAIANKSIAIETMAIEGKE
jgi:predicted transcriptional regulator